MNPAKQIEPGGTVIKLPMYIPGVVVHKLQAQLVIHIMNGENIPKFWIDLFILFTLYIHTYVDTHVCICIYE